MSVDVMWSVDIAVIRSDRAVITKWIFYSFQEPISGSFAPQQWEHFCHAATGNNTRPVFIVVSLKCSYDNLQLNTITWYLYFVCL